jgi:phenylacetate-CoA ligase
MSAYTSLCSSVLFPIHERLKGHDSVEIRRRLEQQERWPRERLGAWRGERLRAFLASIDRDVPHFTRQFAARGFDPAKVKSVADLQRLPRMDKATIRDAGESLKAAGARGLKRYNTGGSSGEPLRFWIGRDRRSHDVGAKWRVTRWWGVDIGDPEIVLWGSPIELGAQDRVKRWRDAMLRTRLLPAFDMSEAKLDAFVATIREVRPAMLFGYPSALHLLAEHARARGQRMDDLGIRVAFVTSERLYEHQRSAIATTFGCAVANGYGARDAGFIAHECPAGGMHVQAEDVIIEICDDDGRQVAVGQPGEIVVTHLATHDFPFVRYRTGDVGVLSDEACACGRTLPLLGEIQGRSTDFVLAADGTVMHGLALIYTVRDLPGVRKFRIVQHTTTRTDVEIVAGPEFDPASEARIRRDFAARLGDGVAVRIALVDDIAPERSGKYRYVVSHVAGMGVADHASVSA